MNFITILTSRNPTRVCKAFRLKGEKLEKHSIATIVHADAKAIEVDPSRAMFEVLPQVTESENQAIVLGRRRSGEKLFQVITEAELANFVDSAEGEGGGYVFSRVAARTSRYNEVARGNFPEPVRNGARVVGRHGSELAKWIETRQQRSIPYSEHGAKN